MAKLITLNDIMDMKDRDELILSKDTIITPSARDWASEHGIRLVMADQASGACPDTRQEKEEVLNQLVANIVKQLKAKGATLNQKEIASIARSCLEKMNCIVD
ncbi:MAG: hypothetical protein GX809_00765 [Clostridiaceae bacterium]|nr:hypothetical protein [Clostridiaceae bacterium]